MNAARIPGRSHSADDQSDRRPELREFIHENLWLARLQLGLACQYLEIGDDVGLAYAFARFKAYARVAAETINDLKAAAPTAVQRREDA